MANVQQPRPAPTYDSRRSQVVGVAEARTLAVSYTNRLGERNVCLALVFGRDAEDGEPGVFILANPREMEERIMVASSVVKNGVREWLAQNDASSAVPPSVADLDLDDLGEDEESEADEENEADAAE